MNPNEPLAPQQPNSQMPEPQAYQPVAEPAQPAPNFAQQPVASPIPQQPQPQFQQQPQPQPMSPGAPQAFADPNVTKKIHNAGRSMFALGIFFTVVSVLIAVFAAKSMKTAEIVLLASYIALSIALTVIGAKTRQASLESAKRYMVYGIGLTAGLLVTSIIKMVIVQSGLGIVGLLSLVTAVYLIVVRSKLK